MGRLVTCNLAVAMLASVVLASSAFVAVAAPVEFVAEWGMLGSGPGQLHWPMQIAIGSNGELYVVDHGNDRVQVFTTDGAYLREWHVVGDTPEKHPIGIAVGSGGSVYVTDDERVKKYTPNGTFVKRWGSWGSCDGQFMSVTTLAVDGAGNVWTNDVGNHRIQVFDSEGDFVSKFGSWTTPCNEETDEYDDLWGGMCRSQSGNVFAPLNGTTLVEYSTTGTIFNQWSCLARGFAAQAPGGNVYVGWGESNKVLVFSSTGESLGEFGEAGAGPGQFNFPTGIAVDANGFIYVADLYNHRIQKFASANSTAATSTSWGQIKAIFR